LVPRLRERPEWKFFGVLPRADRPVAYAWWAVLVARGLVPALFAIAMGAVVGAVQSGDDLAVPLAFVGVVFILGQVLTPLHQAIGANLGDRLSAWLYDRLTEACVEPPGMAHLEDPELASDLTMARDFDMGMSGPPMSISMDFIASGLVELLGGVSSAVVLAAYAWWAPLVLGGALASTHWLRRESAVWKDRNTDDVRQAQRDADYAYRLAVDPPAAKELRLFGLVGWTIERFVARPPPLSGAAAPPAAKELRLFGLVGWTIERFVARRRHLYELQHRATRLRERPLGWCVALVTVANVAVFWSLADAAADARLGLH